MKKKWWTHTACAAALAVLAAGCSNGGNSNNSLPAGKQGADDADKTYTVTGIDFIYGDVPPMDGRGVKMINEKFKIDYKMNFIPQATYTEKLTSVFASGSIPDIVGMSSGDLANNYSKFAKQGAFLALDDYIDDYPTLRKVPSYIWDQLRVNGKVYGIPNYYPKFGFTTIVRQDWLDNLGLKPPTNYEELKQVAIAFTKNDPDRNGKNDTYGIAIGININPALIQGPYWDPAAWYHKDDKGRFIPGIISNARKDIISMFADLYKENAITRDFATMNWADTNKEFYSGKAGIFIGTPRGMSQPYMEGLLQLNPNARFVHLEPFTAPDGSKGMTAGRGFSGITVLSAEVGKDPGKVKRILEMIDYGRTYYPEDRMNEKDPNFDWFMGNLGQGYEIVNGVGVAKKNASTEGLAPITYFPDNTAWPEKDSDINYAKSYTNPTLSKLVQEIGNTYAQIKYYATPNYSVISATELAKGADLNKYIFAEQTKMIAGQRPLSDWDKMVEEWKAKGGEQMIQEINAEIKIKDPKEAWN